jgi:serine phosphatase RsbU (regulator of sigma subunit)
MATTPIDPSIDEYLRKRLMPVEGSIPQIPHFEMYGCSIPAETVGGDIFEYINFQQRYDIDARIQRARKLAQEFLDPLPKGMPPRNAVDAHVEWLRMRPGFTPETATHYREALSSEQLRVAEDLDELYTTAGVLIVDAQGHGIISAKIASTVHDTFHALMLSELDRMGKTTPELFERINLRLAKSVTARNALGRVDGQSVREIATMLYGEVRPNGSFRFVNFGHPPPLVYSAAQQRFLDVLPERMVQFLPLGLEVPEDDPDRKRYFSMHHRLKRASLSDIVELELSSPGDALFLYTDGVFDGTDEEDRSALEAIMREHCLQPARLVCSALLQHAQAKDDQLRQAGEADRVDDKTVILIKRN